MNKYIYDKLKKIYDEDIVSFHMPGHKNGRLFSELGYDEIMGNLYKLDTTEIMGTDNLHNPKEIILKSQIQAKEILFPNLKNMDEYDLSYLVNGTTSGIEAAIMSSCKSGDTIIMNRNCHQSAYNACLATNIKPVFVEDSIDIKNGILDMAKEDAYIKAIDKNENAKAIFITRPTYYGQACDIERLVSYAHEKSMLVIVDEAHGAHFGLSDKLPDSAVYSGADIVVQSLHKTLPAFTQASVLVSNRKKVDKNKLSKFLTITQTSSPSYLIMMSLEIALEIYKEKGTELMDNLISYIKKFKKKQKKYPVILGSDPTKIFIRTIDRGINGYDFAKLLRHEYNIQVELANYYGVLALCTIGNNKDDFDSLDKAINDIAKRKLFGPEETIYEYNSSIEEELKVDKSIRPIYMSKMIVLDMPKNIPDSVLTPREAMDLEKESIKIEKSLGKICGEFIIPYPPGICLIGPGELINQEIVDFILKARELDVDINGMESKDFKHIKIINNKIRK